MSIIGDTKKFIREKLVKRAPSHPHHLMSASRTWVMLLLIFIILNIASFAFSGYLFMQISKGEIFVVEKDTRAFIDTIDRTLLKETISFFEDKSLRFEELKDNRPSLVDPSE